MFFTLHVTLSIHLVNYLGSHSMESIVNYSYIKVAN